MPRLPVVEDAAAVSDRRQRLAVVSFRCMQDNASPRETRRNGGRFALARGSALRRRTHPRVPESAAERTQSVAERTPGAHARHPKAHAPIIRRPTPRRPPQNPAAKPRHPRASGDPSRMGPRAEALPAAATRQARRDTPPAYSVGGFHGT